MTFMSDNENSKISPETLRNKLKDVQLSEAQKLMGDIITENEGLTYKETAETIDAQAEQNFVDIHKKKKRFTPFFAAALISLAVFTIVISFAFSPLFDFAKEAIAGNENKGYEMKSNNHEVTGKGMTDSGTNVDMLTASVDDWEKVANIKGFLPELLIPEYMPEGTEFEGLNVSKWEENAKLFYKAEYTFKSPNGSHVGIDQRNFTEDLLIKDIKKQPDIKEINLGGHNIIYTYHRENEEMYVLTSFFETQKVSVGGNLSENEMLDIIKHMK